MMNGIRGVLAYFEKLRFIAQWVPCPLATVRLVVTPTEFTTVSRKATPPSFAATVNLVFCAGLAFLQVPVHYTLRAI